MSVWADIHQRSNGIKVKKEDDSWEGIKFNHIDLVNLPGPEKVSIKSAALASFNLGGFPSLDEMLSKLGVTLVISSSNPKRIVPEGVSEWVLYWENELKRLESILGRDFKSNRLYEEAQKELDKAKNETEAWAAMAYLGCYDRFGKRIILFLNNLPANNRNEFLVTTFVHEAMHAYFDRHPHELFPYVATIEEPLAEFGMLLFMKEAKKEGTEEAFADDILFNWSKEMVVSKKTCYRYGAVLMDRYEKGDNQIRQDLESYKRKLF